MHCKKNGLGFHVPGFKDSFSLGQGGVAQWLQLTVATQGTDQRPRAALFADEYASAAVGP